MKTIIQLITTFLAQWLSKKPVVTQDLPADVDTSPVEPSLDVVEEVSTGVMKLSDKGVTFITDEEGVRTKAYQDQIGVWTIGIGHTGPEVREGLVWTLDKVKAVFRQDVARFEDCISNNVTIPLEQHEFDALVSFAFNVGTGNFKSSTLLKNLNTGDRASVPIQLTRWNKAGGKVLPVLVQRRSREGKLFATGEY